MLVEAARILHTMALSGRPPFAAYSYSPGRRPVRITEIYDTAGGASAEAARKEATGSVAGKIVIHEVYLGFLRGRLVTWS